VSAKAISEVLSKHQWKMGYRDMKWHCYCGWTAPIADSSFVDHQAEALEAAGLSTAPERPKGVAVAEQLLKLGNEHQLGGNGQPVGIVVIYESEAFINASWGGVPEDRMKALVDAAASEGMKAK
jgi:hypothetical protein